MAAVPADDRVRASRVRVVLLVVLLAAFASARAITIQIDTFGSPEARLEIRSVTLPGGDTVELYVLTAPRALVTIDDQQLEASHVEFDFENRVVRVIGFGTVTSAEETLAGDDLILELDDATFTGRDVLIVTEAIDVAGASAARVPGQISVVDGSFSPCSRCDQQVEDYGFRAARLELFPGDRLVAFDVTVLIRGRAVLPLPILVVPLGPPNRQPRLAIRQGSETERAEIELDWPYVSGANAFGVVYLRYWADVTPGEGGFFDETLLGGRGDESYLGGGFLHLFYTDTGEGEVELFRTPGFLDADGERSDPELLLRARYATLEDAPGPELDFGLVRDDAERNELVEWDLRIAERRGGIRGEFFGQGFVDLDPDDEVDTPAYATRSVPLRTPFRLRVGPDEPIELGQLAIRELELELAGYQDVSNLGNRSAADRPRQSGGRLLERHRIDLEPLPLWGGFELSGGTRFRGQYYDTGERLVLWDFDLSGRQAIGELGSFGVAFRRDYAAGETPFRFDQLAARERTTATSDLRFEPASWIGLETRGGYVFTDLRNPEAEGWEPLQTTLTLFGDRSWIDLRVGNSYDIEEEDPGTIDTRLTLRTPGRELRSRIELRHVQDLDATRDRLTGAVEDDTSTRAELAFELPSFAVDASLGYRYRPPLPEPDEPAAYWEPLELGLTLGTLDQQDAAPGLRIDYSRDLNAAETDEVGYRATARVGVFELDARQRFDAPDGRFTESRYTVLWRGVAALEGNGFPLVQPEWFNLERDRDAAQGWTVTLRDAPQRGQPRWQLRYRTTFDPTLDDDAGGFRGSALEASVELEESRIGAIGFSADLFANLLLEDDVLEVSYLERASLALGVDFFGRVGLQGEFGYRGALSADRTELSRAALTFDEVTLTVRALDELYLGATLDDTWDFSDNDPAASPFNLQPTFFLIWDRCCWALYATWNSADGTISVALTTPGGSEGLVQELPTGLVLPGRETP